MNNPQKRRKKSGFTLLEILLVLGVLSILTGLGLPLLVRRSQLRRAEETKVHLKQAFEALFGNPERPVPNLLAETGFQPPDGILKLKFLVNKDAIPGLRLPDPVADGQSVRIGTVNIKLAGLGGWKGPYWKGPLTQDNAPADAWGQPIYLAAEGGKWQVRSSGPDLKLGNDDDIVYPPVPVDHSRYRSRVRLHITSPRGAIVKAVLFSWKKDGTIEQEVLEYELPRHIDDDYEKPKTLEKEFKSIPSGRALLVTLRDIHGWSLYGTRLMNLLPGQEEEVHWTVGVNEMQRQVPEDD